MTDDTYRRIVDEMIQALDIATADPAERTRGLTLRLYRVAAGVEARAVADRMGRSKQSVSNIERRGADPLVATEYLRAVRLLAEDRPRADGDQAVGRGRGTTRT